MWRAFFLLLRRDLLLAYRHRSELINPLLFFLIVISLFPLAVGPEKKILQMLAPGIIWVAALLATLLSFENLFRSDFSDGALEQLVLTPQPLPLMVLSKVISHWLLTGFPLLLISPLLGVLLFVPGEAMGVLMATLLLGTPILSLIGAIGTALTVGLRRGGMLLALLVLPLYIPVLIFATSAVYSAITGLPATGQLYLMAALLVMALTLTPPAIAMALKVSFQ